MICSAPSRFAAITPQRPTAPSPTTRRLCRRDIGATAAWWPVPITSESDSSAGMSASSSPPGARRACRPPAGRAPPHPARRRRRAAPEAAVQARVCSPSRQNTQVPSDTANGATTRSPGLTVRTSAPTSSTMPMNSWPIRRPASSAPSVVGPEVAPADAARVTRTSASVGSIRGRRGRSRRGRRRRRT